MGLEEIPDVGVMATQRGRVRRFRKDVMPLSLLGAA
jgi:hypothetical protein